MEVNKAIVGALNVFGDDLIKRYSEEIEHAQIAVRQGKPEMAAAAIARSTAFRDMMQDLSRLVKKYEP